MDSRNLWATWGSLVAAIAAGVAVAAVAWQDQGGNASVWWFVSIAMFLVAVGIALFGLYKPWRVARAMWRQTDRFSMVAGWRASHAPIPLGVRFDLVGPHASPLPIMLCELKRYGSGRSYLAYITNGEDNPHPPTSSIQVRFPEAFEASDGGWTPHFEAQEQQGCYMQVWWAWDPTTHRKFPVARECFVIYGSGGYSRKLDDKCKGRCQ
jgi:hypothetical protein